MNHSVLVDFDGYLFINIDLSVQLIMSLANGCMLNYDQGIETPLHRHLDIVIIINHVGGKNRRHHKMLQKYKIFM